MLQTSLETTLGHIELFKNSSDLIIILNNQLEITYSNPKYHQTLDIDSYETRHYLRDFRLADPYITLFKECLENGENQSKKRVNLIKSDGRDFEFAMHITPLSDGTQVQGLFLQISPSTSNKISYDVSDIRNIAKDNQRELTELKMALERETAERKKAKQQAKLASLKVIDQNNKLLEQIELFRKFVPSPFEQAVGQRNFDIDSVHSREEPYSVLFCDIRKFTTFSESISSTECFKFLNSYFRVMEPDIRGFGGFVYQYIGDGIMALYKYDNKMAANNALHSAISLQDRIVIYNTGRKRAGYEPISIGIGINTGQVAIGIAGTNHRMGSGAFGSTVNLASRCEGITKELSAKIIITEYTYQRLNNPKAFLVRYLGKSNIRGLKKSIKLYEVFNADEPRVREEKLKNSKETDNAFELLEQNNRQKAYMFFRRLERRSSYDNLPSIMVKRLRSHA